MKQKINKTLLAIADHLSACMAPLIPVIIAGSLVKLICLLLDMGGVLSGTTGEILTVIGDAPFYFLPILVAVTAAEHFGADRFYTLGTACMLMMPDFLALLEQSEMVTFAGIPVVHANYTYNILPIVLMAWLISRFEPKAAKKFPKVLKATIYPLLVFVVCCACAFLVIGPIGALISSVFSALITVLSEHAGILAWPLYAAVMPVLIPMGMHWIFVTMAITQISMYGFDNGVMAGFLITNMALAGADFAVVLRTKDTELRSQAISAGITVLLSGVSEPSLFGICLKEKRALKGAMAAGAAAGIYLGITKIRCYVYSFPAFVSILMFQGGEGSSNLFRAVILGVLSVICGFLFTIFFMKDKE